MDPFRPDRLGGLGLPAALPPGLRLLSLLVLLVTGLALGEPARAEITALRVASGLASPLFATAPPQDDRLFIVERAGTIRVLEEGEVLPTPFLDISDRVGTGGERGLLGLAFPDDYAQSGLFYVYYTDSGGDSTISRFQVSDGDPDVADSTEEVLFTLSQPQANHNGGTIAFGPDGFLYFAPGDGGGANDPQERAQDPQQLLGKMLRLDVGPDFAQGSTPVAGTGYAIPADNPFVGDPEVRDEIWALGLRNPYRFSFDRETGDLWIADVGQGAREEIDWEPEGDPGGRNWGWDVMEGTLCNDTDPAPSPPCDAPSLSLPLFEYPHTGGRCSITGGFVVRSGPTGPSEWQGEYTYGDFCTGQIWTLDPTTGQATEWTAALGDAAGQGFQLVGFGEDGFGRIHVVLSGGEVFRVEQEAACNDGIDNDGDGLVDASEDPGCLVSVAPQEDPACDDGMDNDGDGAVDLEDPQCRGIAGLDSEEGMACGLGAELALALLPLSALRVARRSRRRVASR